MQNRSAMWVCTLYYFVDKWLVINHKINRKWLKKLGSREKQFSQLVPNPRHKVPFSEKKQLITGINSACDDMIWQNHQIHHRLIELPVLLIYKRRMYKTLWAVKRNRSDIRCECQTLLVRHPQSKRNDNSYRVEMEVAHIPPMLKALSRKLFHRWWVIPPPGLKGSPPSSHRKKHFHLNHCLSIHISSEIDFALLFDWEGKMI